LLSLMAMPSARTEETATMIGSKTILTYEDVRQVAPPLELHEVRTATDAQTVKWRDRQLLFSRRTCGRCPARDLPRGQARSPWVHQERGSRICGTRGIRINAIGPGLIWTPMADQNRIIY
jgi:hypothetical protein